MATSSAKVKKANKAKTFEESDAVTYAKLRIAIDGFEDMALYYFYGGNDPKERKKRVEQIGKRVKAFQEWVKGHENLPGCPGGWCECDGFCVSPPCGFCP